MLWTYGSKWDSEFVVAPPSLESAAALTAMGLGFGAVGYVLSSRAGPRWDGRYRIG